MWCVYTHSHDGGRGRRALGGLNLETPYRFRGRRRQRLDLLAASNFVSPQVCVCVGGGGYVYVVGRCDALVICLYHIDNRSIDRFI
jgi:hypothetical protein